MLALGERRKLLLGVLRELEVVLLGDHLQVLGQPLDERHLEPVLAVHVPAGLPKLPQTGREGIGYFMGAQRGAVHVRHGLVQGDGVRVIYKEPVHRLREEGNSPARDVPGRVREDLVEPSGGCPGKEGADQVERLALSDAAVVTGPYKPAQEGEELGRLGPIKANLVHGNP